MTSLIITLEANPDKLDDFLRDLAVMAETARTQEPGCRRFEVTRMDDRPNWFTLAELYDDAAALEAHRLTPHYLHFKKQVEEGNLVLGKTAWLGEVISG